MGCIWSGAGNRASLYRVEVSFWARGPCKYIVLAAARNLDMAQADTSGDQDAPTGFSWDKAERPDAKDFQIRNITGESRVMPPG